MSENKPLCICIVGKSGVGKSYICNALRDQYGLKQVYGYTTRPKRENEVADHIFITEEEANNWNKEEIVAYGVYGNYQYFATREQMDNSDLYIVDTQGLKGLEDKYVDNGNERNLLIIELRARFFNRLYRLIKANGFVKGIKRALRDIGQNKDLDHFDPIVLYNDTKREAESIIRILVEVYDYTSYYANV